VDNLLNDETYIILLKVDNLHNELGHARVVGLMPFSNLFHYWQSQQILWPMQFPLSFRHIKFQD
jgi:hypothetical protein